DPRPRRCERRVRAAAGQGDRHPLRGHPGVPGRGPGQRRTGYRLRRAARDVGRPGGDPHDRGRRDLPARGGRADARGSAARAGPRAPRPRGLGARGVVVPPSPVKFFARLGFEEITGEATSPEVYAELLRSYDEGVAEFLDLDRVKPNTLGNTRMLLRF